MDKTKATDEFNARPRCAFDVMVSAARRRPELMSLRPTSQGKGGAIDSWHDEDAVPVDVAPLHGFRGFDRSELALLDCARKLDRKFHERCREVDKDLAEHAEKRGTSNDKADCRAAATESCLHHGLSEVLIKNVLSYMDPSPMPPPLTQPSDDSCICEVRVHFLPHRDTNETCKEHREEFGYNCEDAGVAGLVLAYSDGTMIKTGHWRGTYVTRPLILNKHEHIVGLKEERFHSDALPHGLSFYTINYLDRYSEYTVFADQDCTTYRRDVSEFPPHGVDISVSSEADHVVTSLSWCFETNRVCKYSTKNKDMIGSESGRRIAGFSPFWFDFETEEEIEDSWNQYKNDEDYLWYNLFRNNVMRKVEHICQRRSIQRVKERFDMQMHDIRDKALRVLKCTDEAHNICMLTKMMNKTKDKVKRKRYRKELRLQYKALAKRVDEIGSQMKDIVNLDAWCAQYKNRCLVTMARAGETPLSKMNNQLQLLLKSHETAPGRRLLVCSMCPGNKVFDPGHVPMWARCIHPDCSTQDSPCCRKHVSSCYYCHEPACHYHLKHSNKHQIECRKTLRHRCGYLGEVIRVDEVQDRRLDPMLCGKILSDENGHNGGRKCDECSALCCGECFIPCAGWRQTCRCEEKCQGFGGKCQNGLGGAKCVSLILRRILLLGTLINAQIVTMKKRRIKVIIQNLTV